MNQQRKPFQDLVDDSALKEWENAGGDPRAGIVVTTRHYIEALITRVPELEQEIDDLKNRLEKTEAILTLAEVTRAQKP